MQIMLAKALTVARHQSVSRLDTVIRQLERNGDLTNEEKEEFILAARDTIVDLTRFLGTEETQKCIEIANLKKFGE